MGALPGMLYGQRRPPCHLSISIFISRVGCMGCSAYPNQPAAPGRGRAGLSLNLVLKSTLRDQRSYIFVWSEGTGSKQQLL